MSTKEIRIANLRKWLANNATPAKEKSYFSQLLSGEAPFGERAARRLESQYKMGDGFLDAPVHDDPPQPPKSTEYLLNYHVTLEEAQILSVFRDTDDTGRAMIKHVVDAARSLGIAVVNNKANRP